MRNYNFNEKLKWQEFQKLVCEVIARREGIQLPTFKEGPAQGIDGLWKKEDSSLVVQVKQYFNFKSLYQELVSKELNKVKKCFFGTIKLSRYRNTT